MKLTTDIKNEAYELALNKYSKSYALDDDNFLDKDVLFTYVAHKISKENIVGFQAVYNFLNRNKEDILENGKKCGIKLLNYLENYQ